jgi:hypothetical protein
MKPLHFKFQVSHTSPINHSRLTSYLVRIFLSSLQNTHGTGVIASARNHSKRFPHPFSNFSYLGCPASGNSAPRTNLNVILVGIGIHRTILNWQLSQVHQHKFACEVEQGKLGVGDGESGERRTITLIISKATNVAPTIDTVNSTCPCADQLYQNNPTGHHKLLNAILGPCSGPKENKAIALPPCSGIIILAIDPAPIVKGNNARTPG